MNYFNQDISSIHQDLVSGKITSEQLTKDTLDNIKKIDPSINAFLSLDEEGALNAARQIDQNGIEKDNVLSGIPVAIKDNILTKNVVTTAASKMLEHFVPIFDATVMKKLHAAGAVLIGKTNLDEFAMGGSTENSAFKITHNPWNVDLVPGGSSGGSAAAVAAGEILFSLGSDTGGSIRQPSAFNGIVGMKPTYGRVSRWGLIAFGSSFDQIGPLTRNVTDNALVLSAISGHDVHDLTSSDKEVPDYTAKLKVGVKNMKIALPEEYLSAGVDENVKNAILAAAKTYEKLGATVEKVSLPHTKYAIAAYYILASSEASSNLQRFDGIRYGYRDPEAKNLEQVYVGSRSKGFGEEVKRRIMLGTFSLSSGFYDAYFNKAAKVRTLIINDFKQVFKDYDLIMAPTAPTPAFKIGSETDPVTMYLNDAMTIPVNMAGLPAMSLPAGFSNDLPIGMQLIGKSFDEATIYQAGYAFEQNTDFHEKLPNVGGTK